MKHLGGLSRDWRSTMSDSNKRFRALQHREKKAEKNARHNGSHNGLPLGEFTLYLCGMEPWIQYWRKRIRKTTGGIVHYTEFSHSPNIDEVVDIYLVECYKWGSRFLAQAFLDGLEDVINPRVALVHLQSVDITSLLKPSYREFEQRREDDMLVEYLRYIRATKCQQQSI